jgi:hypothetical protein
MAVKFADLRYFQANIEQLILSTADRTPWKGDQPSQDLYIQISMRPPGFDHATLAFESVERSRLRTDRSAADIDTATPS